MAMQSQHLFQTNFEKENFAPDLTSQLHSRSTVTHQQNNIQRDPQQSSKRLENLSPALLYRLSIKFSASNPQWAKKVMKSSEYSRSCCEANENLATGSPTH